jgi:hypothetical protein
MLKAKLIKRGISELSPIITANGFQAVGMLIVQPQSQEPKVVINNDKDVPLASHGANPRRTDSVHME